ncbi:hypothetical protein MGYG_09119 [Nannizzia gypsea CBS 118893]|uniref:Uncharacterized protein n=1 Tax=Arthroderma gypseum (strain ATCC MYA-4604 / CBS 118893) TaxID=535722 RepID=E4UYY7_ARTGP|nr:hypothetical protein MGYG_09119 [Nannizzia gypsea CBS 118893]EFR03317.1 hypothetical protein MGYG_09119 [Nannizzia gypsea CBS 118893]
MDGEPSQGLEHSLRQPPAGPRIGCAVGPLGSPIRPKIGRLGANEAPAKRCLTPQGPPPQAVSNRVLRRVYFDVRPSFQAPLGALMRCYWDSWAQRGVPRLHCSWAIGWRGRFGRLRRAPRDIRCPQHQAASSLLFSFRLFCYLATP